jgi:hypothetical protein
LNILRIIQLSNEIDLDKLRRQKFVGPSTAEKESAGSDDAEPELFVMDGISSVQGSIHCHDEREDDISEKMRGHLNDELERSVLRRKKRGSREVEINLEMDDDYVLEQLAATDCGLKMGWHNKKAT